MKRDLGALAARRFDVLVVGGGIYGAACAWDAAQRGLAVALVETGDFASGTTWNSLKTIHGGLRYLQALDLARMRASIRERRTLLRLAPELVRPLPFVVPTYGHGLHGLEALFLGLLINDFVAHDRNRGLPASHHLPPGRMLTRRELFDLFPNLPSVRVSGGALWYDAQVSSEARLVLAYLHAAAEAGALPINYCEALEILRDEGGQVRGARVRDVEAGQVFDVRAAALLNCAGPALATLIERAGLPDPGVKLLRAFNLVLDRPGLGAHALGMRSGGRYLFAVPWQGRAVMGTAYEPAGWEGPGPEGFLHECALAFPWLGLRPEHVCLVHAGLVPGSGGASGLASRPLLIDHAAEGLPGAVSVMGVKLTTARGVAEAAVDIVAARSGRTLAPCRTADTPLARARALGGTLEQAVGVAVDEEQTLHLTDLVLRRLHLGSAGPTPDVDLHGAARALAARLHWGPERAAQELDTLRAFYGRQRGA